MLEELQRRYPGQSDTSVLRTLQRRIRLWRAKFGVEREVYFAQEHPPGRQGISDFTSLRSVRRCAAAAPRNERTFVITH